MQIQNIGRWMVTIPGCSRRQRRLNTLIHILVALIVNVFIGFGTELRAMRSMEALQQMTRRHAKVLRQAKIPKMDADWLFTRTWHVFNMRDAGSSVIFNDVTGNLFVWAAVILSIVLLLVAVYFPPLSRVLTMVVPTPFQWLFILGMSFIPLVVVQILKQGAFFYKRTQEKSSK